MTYPAQPALAPGATQFKVKLQHGADSSCTIKLANKGPAMLQFQAPISELECSSGTVASALDTATHDIEVTITCTPKFQPGTYRYLALGVNWDRQPVEHYDTPPWAGRAPNSRMGVPGNWQRVEVVPYGTSGRTRAAPGICADCDMPETNCACG